MLTAATSGQVGAAAGALAFPVLGPVGVVAIRQWVAAIGLAVAVRPRWWTFTRAQWWPVLALAATQGIMNLTLYASVQRVGLGLGVTLEFLGPLALALLASRRLADLVGAVIALGAVIILARPQPSTDYLGIALGAVAGVCWAVYIVLNQVVGARHSGLTGSATAAMASAIVYVPIGIVVLLHSSLTWAAIGLAVTAGVLASAVTMVCDLTALRYVPRRTFSMFMSLHPVLGAVVGMVVLRQYLPVLDWAAIAVIVCVNAWTIQRSR